MNEDERILADSRITWRESARELASQEADRAGIQGTKREAFLKEREEYHYAEYERQGKENLK